MAVSTHRQAGRGVKMARPNEFRMERLSLLGFALLAAAGTAAGAQQPLSARPTLHTPDVIAPAVLPYLACLYAERGLPLLRATDGTRVTYDKNSSDCSAARARAVVDASK